MSEKNQPTEKKQWKNSNRFCEKLGQRLLQMGLNQQKLARKSDVSDSEISRILTGKSLPGLENAISLARAVGVSLDYLADDKLDSDPNQARSASPADEREAEILRMAREIGFMDALYILKTCHFLGSQIAMHRLLEAAKPIISTPPEVSRPVATPLPASGRASTG